MNHQHYPKYLCLLICAALAACSGGGGSAAPNVQSTPSVASSQVNSSQGGQNGTGKTASQGVTEQPNVPETPKVAPNPDVPETPKAPELPKPSQDELDKQNVARLNLQNIENHSGFEPSEYLALSLKDKVITFDLLPDKTDLRKRTPQIEVETLRDSAGQLVAYYGVAKINETGKTGKHEADNSLHRNIAFYLQNAIDMKLPETAMDLKYSGKMFYNYAGVDDETLKADVQASYHGADKTMSMEVFGEGAEQGKAWVLHSLQASKLKERVAVNEDGSVFGNLMNKDSVGKTTLAAKFNGGFYGENGSVLSGKLEKSGGNLQGVLGATLKPAE